MILGIDPKVDYAFKHLVGREPTRPLLIDLIDKVLNSAPGHQILDLDLLNPFNPKESLDDKLSIVDVKARDQSGRQFNLEMQMQAYRHYEKRILYYGTRLHQQQLYEGQDYADLMPTISISFLDHVLFRGVPSFHLRFRLLEESLHFPLTEDLEFHVIELPKFTKSLEELQSELDIWLYFLRHAAMMDVDALPAVMQRLIMLRAFEELKMLRQNDVERERYEARRKALLDYNTGLKMARLEGWEEGEKMGLERGEKMGLERGEKIGTIHLCERLLNRPETPMDQLAFLPLEDLKRLANELQEQLLKKGKA